MMRDLGLVHHDEPVKRLFTQGMVLKGGVAMSKSKGNVVGAEDMAEKNTAAIPDACTRCSAPPEKDLEWSEQGIEGCLRIPAACVPCGGSVRRSSEKGPAGRDLRVSLNSATPKGKSSAAEGAPSSSAARNQ